MTDLRMPYSLKDAPDRAATAEEATVPHEHRACREYVQRTGATCTWGGHTAADDEQAVVRITRLATTGRMPTVPSARRAG